MRLSELVKHVTTDTARVLRDCKVGGAELCAAVKGPDAVTFLEKEKFLPSLDQPGIAAVICTEDMVERVPSHIRGVLISDAPKFAFGQIHNYFTREQKVEFPPTQIAAEADVSPYAHVSPVGVKIGKDSVIEPGVIIYPGVTIGERVHIGGGTILGSSSFSPSRYRDKAITLLDCGTVVIEDDVEIRSLCSVERGIFEGEETILSNGVKIDQLVLVGHGTYIGPRTFVVGASMICGKCTIGKDAWLGANVTISNRIKIGDSARVSLGAVVTKDVPAGQTVSGNFAIDHRRFLQNLKASLAERPSPVGEQMPPPCGHPENF